MFLVDDQCAPVQFFSPRPRNAVKSYVFAQNWTIQHIKDEDGDPESVRVTSAQNWSTTMKVVTALQDRRAVSNSKREAGTKVPSQ